MTVMRGIGVSEQVLRFVVMPMCSEMEFTVDKLFKVTGTFRYDELRICSYFIECFANVFI